MSSDGGPSEKHDAISVLEYTEAAEEYGNTPGKRVIMDGVQRNIHKRDDENGDFVKVAEAVATIDLFKPLTTAEINEWCNSEVGKHVLTHYFPEVDDPTEDTRRELAATQEAKA